MATIVLVTSGVLGSSGSALTLTRTTLKGNLIVVAIGNPDNRTLTSVTDSAGNTYTINKDNVGNGFGAAIASCKDAFGGVTSVTVTLSGSSTAIHTDAIEIRGNFLSTYVGNTSGGTAASGTALTVTAFTPSSNGFVIAVGTGNNRAWSAGTNYTALSTDAGSSVNGFSERRLSPTSSETCPMTADASTGWSEAAVEFIPAPNNFNNFAFPDTSDAGIMSVGEKIK